MSQESMRRLVNVTLPDICNIIVGNVLGPTGRDLGWWKFGEDIDAKRFLKPGNPHRSLWHSDQSGKRVYGHRYQYYHPNGKPNTGHEITFTDLRLSEIEGVTLGPVEKSDVTNDHSKLIEVINRTEGDPSFQRETERSSEQEKTSTKETEASVEASVSTTISASYMSVSAEVQASFTAAYKQRKEEQKRQLNAMREGYNFDYLAPAGRKLSILHKVGTATVRQKIIATGLVDFNIEIWSDKYGEIRFGSMDEMLSCFAGVSVDNNKMTEYFNSRGGVSEEIIGKFYRPKYTIEKVETDEASVTDSRTITVSDA